MYVLSKTLYTINKYIICMKYSGIFHCSCNTRPQNKYVQIICFLCYYIILSVLLVSHVTFNLTFLKHNVSTYLYKPHKCICICILNEMEFSYSNL